MTANSPALSSIGFHLRKRAVLRMSWKKFGVSVVFRLAKEGEEIRNAFNKRDEIQVNFMKTPGFELRSAA